MNLSIVYALAAAALFGASTPLAKSLGLGLSPILLAGLLYLGSGIGLAGVRLIRDRGWAPSGLTPSEWPWLLGAIAFGGILGPVALMFGLTRTASATASLMLNLESVLTAVIAWVIFRENADRRIVLGMLAIVLGGVVLSWTGAGGSNQDWTGPLAVALACLCWGIDNNLTRKVSASDAVFIAAAKGLIAGLVNCSLALYLGAQIPGVAQLAPILLVGFLGYGISLVMFVLALRGLGSARTGAYFSTAPFLGAAVALLGFAESVTVAFWIASALMAVGVWLHLTERHAHEHLHEATEQGHRHVHDEHHQHEHGFEWDPQVPHSHVHVHGVMRHSHAHFPDVHHRHRH